MKNLIKNYIKGVILEQGPAWLVQIPMTSEEILESDVPVIWSTSYAIKVIKQHGSSPETWEPDEGEFDWSKPTQDARAILRGLGY